MKKLLTALFIGLATSTFGRGIEDVQTQTLLVNYHAKMVSNARFKHKGVKLLRQQISNMSDEMQIKPTVTYKRVSSLSIKIKVQFSRLGKVLVRQSYELNKQSRELFIRTVYYNGYSAYKLQLDGVNQTYEHNPDRIDIDNSNTNNISNSNKNVNKNRNVNTSKSK